MPKHRSLDAGILSAALEGLELQKQRLDRQIAEVRRVLGGVTRKAAVVAVETKKPRRKLSAAARKRIAAAQKKRWEEWRKKGKTAGAKAKR
jgi:regulator of replication initiation timing